MKVLFLWKRLFCLICLVVNCAAQIKNRSSYNANSRSSFQQAIDNVLKPHQEYLIGARTKLSEIFDDASSQGVQYVKLGSKLSEFGYIALGYLSASTRFNTCVSNLLTMDGAQFGTLFAAYNVQLIVGFDRSNDKIVCTFQELMKNGQCTRNGLAFDVSAFKMANNQGGPYEFHTRADLSIEESEANIYRNLQLTASDVPTGSIPESAMRGYLYDHLDSSKMFHFRVYFDGVEQKKYSQPGQGEHISKVLHWELTYSQLYFELIAKEFLIPSSSNKNGYYGYNPYYPIVVETNTTAFIGLPYAFQQGYPVARSTGEWAGVLKPQGMEFSLWDQVKDDFLIDVKSMHPWRLAAHKTE